MVLDRIDRLLKIISEMIDEKVESLLHNCTTAVAQQLSRDMISQDVTSRDVEWEVVIPIEHVVAAYHLFTSRYIQALFPEPIDEDYIMMLEETRGQGEENRHVTQVGVSRYLQGVDFQVTMPSNGWPDQIDGLSWSEIDPKRVKQLYESYIRHIYSLYPFLSESGLKAEIYRFINLYCIP